MTVNEAEAFAGGTSGERAGRNPGIAHAGAETFTACSGQPKSEPDWLMSQVVACANMQLAYSLKLTVNEAKGPVPWRDPAARQEVRKMGRRTEYGKTGTRSLPQYGRALIKP